jgi:hypothetical protein
MQDCTLYITELWKCERAGPQSLKLQRAGPKGLRAEADRAMERMQTNGPGRAKHGRRRGDEI